MTPKAKVRIDKLDHSKIKSFYISKDTSNRVKSQPTEWGKIFVNHVSDKGLVSIVITRKMKIKPTMRKSNPPRIY